MILSIDIETYSETSLQDHGVYRYVEDPHFEILIVSVAMDDEDVETYDLTDPEEDHKFYCKYAGIFTDPNVIKSAYNAQFEITCLSKYLKVQLDPAQWIDTMITAASVGLPLTLEGAGAALGLGEDSAKDKAGKDLIKYFSVPCKPTTANGGRTRNLPSDAPEKWAQYKAYNRQDVVAERTIRKKLERFTPNESEHAAWVLDQQINRRGVLLDLTLAANAIRIATEYKEKLTAEAVKISGLSNPNSVAQLKQYFGVEGSLNKKDVARLKEDATGDRLRMLQIRAETGKSSVSKYKAMEKYACTDGRARGLFQFYGTRTGRWAGRGVQLQNLPQNHIEDLATARKIVADGDGELLEMLYGAVPDILSQLIRTALIPKPGCKFVVADFSAIEARVIAWLAGEQWRQQVFRDGGDIYCASASQMFGVPVVKHGINGHLRQKGKIAELALGYGGAEGALRAMGALEMGLEEKELKPLVASWREANPKITRLWWDVDQAVVDAIEGQQVKLQFGLEFFRSPALLSIQLPGGRCIRYFKPRIIINEYGRKSVEFMAYDKGKWQRVESYGPKFVENIIQAIARDCLLTAMMKVSRRYDIVAHVHDEMICEVPAEIADTALTEICGIMGEPIDWAPGLLLRGDGYLCEFYRKD